ncbi:MAG: nicotinate-nucleotide adenylyltransferase [Dehalococcoidia bacterium]|nr:nicotinate-nucleotide adenylyltransferase [Dehalococcoidia bacterium]MDD5493571.1 nicotinate-nucleotide adenylyltransferase [Dehalococcoidia bacterium]
MKVGILGGSFDPIHLAHLIIAEEARTKLDLDYVMFIPAGLPWMKSGNNLTGADHRLNMVKIAVQSNTNFKFSTVEVDQPGPSYTVDTLEKISKELGPKTEIFFLLGWDSLAEMPKWKAPYRISKMAKLVAFPRPGFAKPDLSLLESSMPDIANRIVMLDGPYIGISSTTIRAKVASGKSVRYLVPPDVEEYINKNRLYQQP